MKFQGSIRSSSIRKSKLRDGSVTYAHRIDFARLRYLYNLFGDNLCHGAVAIG
jgi:hypothetical protein